MLALKNNGFFELARPVHWIVHGPDGRVRMNTKGDFEMYATLNNARETATVFAGAFISALLLVSAATSLPIA
jgi:hypothetical protein